jgi:hypothetical protein
MANLEMCAIISKTSVDRKVMKTRHTRAMNPAMQLATHSSRLQTCHFLLHYYKFTGSKQATKSLLRCFTCTKSLDFAGRTFQSGTQAFKEFAYLCTGAQHTQSTKSSLSHIHFKGAVLERYSTASYNIGALLYGRRRYMAK